ncbi:MAG: hypothetical protein WC686_03065 [Candidatus Shapirobacteria bacterium]|jgi:hypothetical protein
MQSDTTQAILKRIEKRLKRIEDLLICNFSGCYMEDEIQPEVQKYYNRVKKIDAALISKKFNVGYARAARIFDHLKLPNIDHS